MQGTTTRWARPSLAATRVHRPRQALLALALAVATAITGLPGATASPASEPLSRVVVTGSQGLVSAEQAVRDAGGSVLDRLPIIGGVSARLPRGSHLAPAFQVVPDRPVGLAGGIAGDGPASTVRQTLGLGAPHGEGAGTTVAVVDTGVADVPDLAGRVQHVDVTGSGTGDGYGHGTFVAGLVAGSGASSGGADAGVAPGAHLLDVRVAHADGSSSLIEVLKGLQVVAAHPEVDVVNLSLSSGSPLPYQLDPLTSALEKLWRRGVTVVVPAGNDGAAGPGSIASPGIDPVLLTVGGLDEHGTAIRGDDTGAAWSSQGPAPQGVAKPELTAPGAHLISLAAPGSVVVTVNPGSLVGSSYLRGSGTSFSSAVTAGAAAALIADRPLGPDQVKILLTSTAYDVSADPTLTGAGGLDLAAALVAPTPRRIRPDKAAGLPGAGPAWGRLLAALDDGHPTAAASSWADLGPEARQGAARQRAGSTWTGSTWTGSTWTGSTWTGSTWTGSTWTGSTWTGSTWTARQWSARQWSARQWNADSWG